MNIETLAIIQPKKNGRKAALRSTGNDFLDLLQ